MSDQGNPRHKERHAARNVRDLLDLGLRTLDGVEKKKSFFEALGEAFGDVRTRREKEEEDHPVGPGLPIGFRGPRTTRDTDPEPVTVTASVMKDGIPYCTAHDIPLKVCTMCRDRSNR